MFLFAISIFAVSINLFEKLIPARLFLITILSNFLCNIFLAEDGIFSKLFGRYALRTILFLSASLLSSCE
jgi:hypothetical protein